MQMSLQPPITSTAIETTNPNSFSRLVSASTMANQVNLKGISKESQRIPGIFHRNHPRDRISLQRKKHRNKIKPTTKKMTQTIPNVPQAQQKYPCKNTRRQSSRNRPENLSPTFQKLLEPSRSFQNLPGARAPESPLLRIGQNLPHHSRLNQAQNNPHRLQLHLGRFFPGFFPGFFPRFFPGFFKICLGFFQDFLRFFSGFFQGFFRILFRILSVDSQNSWL